MVTKQKFKNVHTIIDNIIVTSVKEGNTVVDATCGNGNDTFKLAKLIGHSGNLFAFDIQNIAIENTKNLLSKNNLLNENIIIIKDSHENVNKYNINDIDFAIMNLGYLPKGDKNIFTKSESSIKFINYTLNLLNTGGLIVIAMYTGFDEGASEAADILKFVSNLDQKLFNVVKIEFLNQVNSPPSILVLERI